MRVNTHLGALQLTIPCFPKLNMGPGIILARIARVTMRDNGEGLLLSTVELEGCVRLC